MKIGLDARMIGHSGIGTTIRGLLDHLSPERRRQITLFAPPEWKNPYECAVRPAPEAIYGLAQHFGYGRRIEREGLDLYHMPHFDVPFSYRGPLVATIHDLIHILFPEHSTKPFSRAYARFQVGRVVKRATRILTVSENTKRDLERLFPGAERKTTVVYPAASGLFRPLSADDVDPALKRHGLERGYLLYVGNLRGSKNTPALIAAYGQARAAAPDLPPLVLVGANTYREYDNGFPAGIRHVASVPLDDLPAFYNGASMFVFPSLYEGFGLPPLEAMACGAPVIATKAASVPEVCGDAAVYIDPSSVEGLAMAIRDLWASPSRREALRARGLARAQRFTWTSFAEATWRVYEEAAGARA